MTQLFASLKPYKKHIEDFSPNDTMPWMEIAKNYLKCVTPTGFISTRPFSEIKKWTDWISQNIGLFPTNSILDVGCGPGSFSNELAKLGYHVTGIDISDTLLEYAQSQAIKENISAEYIKMSMKDIDYISKFDLILMFQSIFNSLTIGESSDILLALSQALKPGGSLLLEIELFSNKVHHIDYIKEGKLTVSIFSPWSDKFHAWLERVLLFTEERQKITHHLIHAADEEPKEYWYRSFLYHFYEINNIIHSHGMYVYRILNPISGDSCDVDNGSVLLWIKK